MIDLRQTLEYANYMRRLSWEVKTLEKNQVYIRKIPLIGKIAKLQRPKSIITARSIDKFAKEHNISVFYLEPAQSSVLLDNFQLAQNSFLPSKTAQIDLKKPTNTIFNSFKKSTRYEIKHAEKSNVKIVTSHNIDKFIALWSKSALKRGMWLPQKKEIIALSHAFGNHATLLFAYPNLQFTPNEPPIAALLLVSSSTTAYYMYAASTPLGNKVSAPSLLVWKAIKKAKTMRRKMFDFEGIYDERYKQTKSWKGFSRFKLGFGGKVIEHPPTLVRYYNPIAKLLRL